MSFKHKLVGFFVVLSLLPLAGAFWGFNEAAERTESSRADARLEAGLRAALAAYADELAQARRLARALASDRAVQAALVDDDTRALRRLARANPNVQIRDRDGETYGAAPASAGVRRVDVVSERGRLIGTISGYVPLDDELLARLRTRAALEEDDRLVVGRAGGAAAGLNGITTVELDGTEYRALAAPLDAVPPRTTLAVASPTAKIASATQAIRRNLLLVVAAALLAIGGIAYVIGRGIVRNLSQLAHAAHQLAAGRLGERVPARGSDEFARLGRAFNDMAQQLEERLAELELERTRLREATGRLGEALSATHDPDQLLRVVVETAVEATGASGGVIVDADGRRSLAGRAGEGADRIELPLNAGRTSFGTLVLTGDVFDGEHREMAASLASHAVIALENARLHRIVERQALVDGLTGLANRRSAEEALVAELARSERFGAPLSVVLADLDDFKAVNDRHGHAAGDAVLRVFADVLRETLREIDLASRWGGEEFALVLPGTDLAGAVNVADRVRAALEERPVRTADGVSLRVTASFGVASFPELATPEELLAAADAALYAAKRAGKNRVLAAADAVAQAQPL